MFGYPIRDYFLHCCKMPGGLIATYPDFLAVGVVIALTLVVASGVKLTSKFNMVFVILNLTVILFIFGKYLRCIYVYILFNKVFDLTFLEWGERIW